jgi:5-methylcytosine-specific restriction endonuclease McrA
VPTPETKCCRGCGNTKPVEEFKKNRLWCIPCYNAREAKAAAEWRRANPGVASRRVMESRKRHMEPYLAARERYAKSGKAKLAAKAWVDRNREHLYLYNRARRAMRRGMRKLVTIQRIQELRVLQKNKCVACHVSLNDGYHVDHVMPVALGGDSSPHNLQLLCPTCNCSKGAKHPVDFMQRIGRLL